MGKSSVDLYISALVCGNGKTLLISCGYKIVEGVPCNKAFNSSFPKEKRNLFEIHGLCNCVEWTVF